MIKIPKTFTDCQKGGGRIVTKKLPKGKYMHICYDKNGAHPGEVKTKKSTSELLNELFTLIKNIRK